MGTHTPENVKPLKSPRQSRGITVFNNVPRFLHTLGRPHAVAIHFADCGQLATGLAPVGLRPCWAHKKKVLENQGLFYLTGGVDGTRTRDPRRDRPVF